MTTTPSEEHLIELVSWLEKTGHDADASKLFSSFTDGERSSCCQVGYEFGRVESQGIFEVRFWFPVKELEKVCPINDVVEFGKWLDAISTDGIEAMLVDDKKLGKCVLVKRLHYIPEDKRQAWISDSVIPSPEFSVLARLLNLRIKQTSQGIDKE